MTLLAGYFRRLGLALAGMVMFAIFGVAAMFIGQFAAASLDLSKDAAMYVSLGAFLLMLIGSAWAYDRYRAWRFFRGQP
jgi:hypothetical protein